MDFIEVEVLSWEKYNPRKDYKKPWWFALSNGITTDQIFSEFSDAEFKAWIHILCTASVQNKPRAQVFFKHAERACGIKRRNLMSAISKLEKLQVIRIPGAICTESVRDLYATEQNSTIQNRTNNNAHAEAFALFWSGYPRKVGKEKTEALFKKAIAAGATPSDLMQAQAKYKEQLKKDGTESKFILHGPTFLGRWRDFLDPDYGAAESFAPEQKSILQVLQEAK